MAKAKKATVTVVALTAVLILTLALLVYTLCRDAEKSVIGTYCTGEGISADDKYFVFQQDGSYIIYRQFQLLETGAYATDDASIFALSPAGQAEKQYVVFDNIDVIYYYAPQGGVIALRRLSDIPMFVNLPDYDSTH